MFLMGVAGLAYSCGSYTKNVMFKVPVKFEPDKITREAIKSTEGYTLQKNDYLYVDVFSNKGERIVAPYPELMGSNLTQVRRRINYVVSTAVVVRLPMVGGVALEGLTKQKAYQSFCRANSPKTGRLR